MKPAPGQGASHLEAASGRSVYVVRSRRTGAVSLGIDLTPEGACPFACDYCQVPAHGPPSAMRPVDLDALREELAAALAHHRGAVGDVAFAGSGEPTWSPSFLDALRVAVELAGRESPRVPVRVFTCAATLDRDPLRDALADLVRRGAGEVWVKLDAWDDASLQRIDGVRGEAAHEARVLRLAREAPVVVQALVARRADGPSVDDAARGLAAALARLLAAGARIDRVIVTTMVRPPGVVRHGLAPCDARDLDLVADALRATGTRVERVQV